MEEKKGKSIVAVVIDDDAMCREQLSDLLLENAKDVEVKQFCSSAAEGIEAIKKWNPDLIFLDVEMPVMNGFEMLKKIDDIKFETIFTTAYGHYAISAIKISALDFLLKPVAADDLAQALQRARLKIASQHQQMKIDALLHNINYMKSDKKMALPTSSGLELVSIGEIIRLESDSNYTVFHVVNRSAIMVSRTLGDYEEMLSEYHFFRVHQSHLINLRYVKTYTKGEGGWVTMTDNSTVDVSRRKKEEFLKRFTIS